MPGADGMVDLGGLMSHLGEREIASVVVEGGGVLLGALFDGGLVDKVCAFIAPVVVGGAGAPSPVAGEGVELIGDALRLSDVEVLTLGGDIAVVGVLQTASGLKKTGMDSGPVSEYGRFHRNHYGLVKGRASG